MPAERELLTHPLVKQHNKDSRLECRPCLFVRSCPRFNWCSLEPLLFRRLLLKGHQKFSLNFWSAGAGIWMLKKMEYLLYWSIWTCINKLKPSSESLRMTNLVFIGSGLKPLRAISANLSDGHFLKRASESYYPWCVKILLGKRDGNIYI